MLMQYVQSITSLLIKVRHVLDFPHEYSFGSQSEWQKNLVGDLIDWSVPCGANDEEEGAEEAEAAVNLDHAAEAAADSTHPVAALPNLDQAAAEAAAAVVESADAVAAVLDRSLYTFAQDMPWPLLTTLCFDIARAW